MRQIRVLIILVILAVVNVESLARISNCSTFERSYEQVLSRKRRFLIFNKGGQVIVRVKLFSDSRYEVLREISFSIRHTLESKLSLAFQEASTGFQSQTCSFHYRLSHDSSHNLKICCLERISPNRTFQFGWLNQSRCFLLIMLPV